MLQGSHDTFLNYWLCGGKFNQHADEPLLQNLLYITADGWGCHLQL